MVDALAPGTVGEACAGHGDPMTLKRVVSGGQTGADQQGLFEGRRLGLETGGWVPKGWRTEDGPAPWLAAFGCLEHDSSTYPPRTAQNVADSEATLWFGHIGSPGYYCTYNAVKRYRRDWHVNPGEDIMQGVAEHYTVINVAGNRASINPGVANRVTVAFAILG